MVFPPVVAAGSSTARFAARRVSMVASTSKFAVVASPSLQLARRDFSGSSSSAGILSSIRERLQRVALGNNYNKALEVGGVTPEQHRQREFERKRDAALASVSPDGTPMFEDVQDIPVLQEQARKEQRISAKILIRQARKRWNATDPITGEVLEHKYSTATFKISPRKLRMLAKQISGQPIDHAILQMQFSAKRASKRIVSTLALAKDHAAGKGMDVNRLIVSEAWVGKGRYLTRIDIKGRSRMGKKHHPSARMSIVLRYGKTWQQKEQERLLDARKRVRAIGTGGVVRTNKKIVNVFQRPGWAW